MNEDLKYSILPQQKVPGVINPEDKRVATDNVTQLQRVDPNNYYSADRDKGSVLGKDLDSAYWNLYKMAGGSGGGGGGIGANDFGNVKVAGDPSQFSEYQEQTTQYMSDLMKGAADKAKGMFGQGAVNQITGDNDVMVQRELQKLEQEYAAKGLDATHPAFVKAKNQMLAASKMINNRVMTDMIQKAGEYGIKVGELATNYYDVFSSKVEKDKELQLAADQFNEQMKFKTAEANASAASAASSRAFGQQMAALAALSANRKFEASLGLQASTTELQARSAEKVSMMNWAMENRKLDVAERTAKAQQKNALISSLIGAVGSIVGFAIGKPKRR